MPLDERSPVKGEPCSKLYHAEIISRINVEISVWRSTFLWQQQTNYVQEHMP